MNARCRVRGVPADRTGVTRRFRVERQDSAMGRGGLDSGREREGQEGGLVKLDCTNARLTTTDPHLVQYRHAVTLADFWASVDVSS